jgi:pyruvate/2-oxoglutarate dehydrogenase complex dihydrolipoamide acyltransferase (E2) component
MRQKKIDVKFPWFSPEVTTARVIECLVKVGDRVEIDQDLLNLKIEGEDFILPSPLDGIVLEILVEPEDWVEVDQVLATLELV